jgi:hypothetical protein
MRELIIIELREGLLRLVEMEAAGAAVVVRRTLCLDLPPGPLDPAWLRLLWQRERIINKKVVLLIPESLVSHQTLSLPDLPAEQLEKALRFELESHTTAAGRLGRVINRVHQEKRWAIKTAMVENTALAELIQPFTAAGLNVEWSGLRLSGVVELLRFQVGAGLTGFDETALFLLINEGETEFGIAGADGLLFWRNFIPGGSGLDRVDGRDAFREEFQEELRLSLAASRAVLGESPHKVWFFGDLGLIPYLSELFNGFNLQLVVPERTGCQGVLPGAETPQLAPLIGLGIAGLLGFSDPEAPIRTLIQEKRESIQRCWRFRLEAAILALLICAGIALTLAAGGKQDAAVEHWLSGQEHLLAELQQTEKTTTIKLLQIQKLEQWQAGRDHELAFLMALQENLPSGARITDLAFEDGVVKDLSGLAPSASLLLQRLHRIPILAKLKLKGTVAVTPQGEVFHLEGLFGKDGAGPFAPGPLAGPQTTASPPAKLGRAEAYRLLQKRAGIEARATVVNERLGLLGGHFFPAADPESAQLDLLRRLESMASGAGLEISNKNTLRFGEPEIGAAFEGKSGVAALIRFMQRVAASPDGIRLKRLQMHGQPEQRLISYSITISALLTKEIR